jgi:hypothetical protein
MPLRAVKTILQNSVRYIFPNGRSMSGVVLGNAGTALAAPGVGTATTGGTLPAATYTYSCTALVNGVETATSATAAQVTTGATSTVTVTAGVTPGATAYRFYGRTAGNQFFMAQQASNVFVDTNAITPNSTILAPASTSTSSLLLPELQNANRLIHGVAVATTVKQTGAYHNRTQ